MLIARLIADMDGVETRLDAALEACAAADMPVALAGMLDFCGDVLQLSLPHGDASRLTAILAEHFSSADLLVADHEIEVPRLFVSDMDSTMIGQECIDELANFAGLMRSYPDHGAFRIYSYMNSYAEARFITFVILLHFRVTHIINNLKECSNYERRSLVCLRATLFQQRFSDRTVTGL